MTSIGVAGSTRMESWIVDMLFVQPGQGKAAPPPAASTAVSALSVASAAKSAVAPVTGQAMAALRAGGTDVASDVGSASSGSLALAPSHAVIEPNNAMTSAQISATYDSGGGLPETGTGQIETFATIVQMQRDASQTVLDRAHDPAIAAAVGQDPDALRTGVAQLSAHADSMLRKSHARHTEAGGCSWFELHSTSGDDGFQAGRTGRGDERDRWIRQQAMRDDMSQCKGSQHDGGYF